MEQSSDLRLATSTFAASAEKAPNIKRVGYLYLSTFLVQKTLKQQFLYRFERLELLNLLKLLNLVLKLFSPFSLC